MYKHIRMHFLVHFMPIDPFISYTLGISLHVLTGRKRKWFKVDEAIRVLQSHKPVHAEYLRRLKNNCSPTCSPTNGNTPGSQVTDNNTPHYVVCSQGSDLVNR